MAVLTFDVVIVGAGPAGLQAGIYFASEGFNTVIIERDKVGGRILQTPKLENFIGQSAEGVSGPTFVRKARRQAENLGAKFMPGEVESVRRTETGCCLFMVKGRRERVEVRANNAIIVATGMQWESLDVPGAAENLNRSFFYGPFMTMSCEKACEYAVIGGGNSSGQAVITLAEHAKRVTVIARSGLNTMSNYLVNRIKALANVNIISGCSITNVHSDGISLSNGVRVTARFTFFNAAAKPNTSWLPQELLEHKGFIRTGENGRASLQTDIANLFAIGDVRSGVWRRNVGNAVSDANRVVSEVMQYINTRETGLGNSIHA